MLGPLIDPFTVYYAAYSLVQQSGSVLIKKCKRIAALKRHYSVSCCKSSSGRVVHVTCVYRNFRSYFHITYHTFSYLIVDCSFLFMSPSVCLLVSVQPCSCRRLVRAFLSNYLCPRFLDQLIELELTHCCFYHKSVKVLQGWAWWNLTLRQHVGKHVRQPVLMTRQTLVLVKSSQPPQKPTHPHLSLHLKPLIREAPIESCAGGQRTWALACTRLECVGGVLWNPVKLGPWSRKESWQASLINS